MERKELMQCMAVLTDMWPNNPQYQNDLAIDRWLSIFKDDSYEDMAEAIDTYIRTDITGRPPAAGILRKTIDDKYLPLADGLLQTYRGFLRTYDETSYDKLPEALKMSVTRYDMMTDALTENVNWEFRNKQIRDQIHAAINKPENTKKLIASAKAAIAHREAQKISHE